MRQIFIHWLREQNEKRLNNVNPIIKLIYSGFIDQKRDLTPILKEKIEVISTVGYAKDVIEAEIGCRFIGMEIKDIKTKITPLFVSL